MRSARDSADPRARGTYVRMASLAGVVNSGPHKLERASKILVVVFEHNSSAGEPVDARYPVNPDSCEGTTL